MTLQDFKKQLAFRSRLLYHFLSNEEVSTEIESAIIDKRDIDADTYNKIKELNKEIPRLCNIQSKELSDVLLEYFSTAAKWLIEFFEDSLGSEYCHEAYTTLCNIASYDSTTSLVDYNYFNQDSDKDKNLGFKKVKAVHWLNMSGDFVVDIKSNNFRLIVTTRDYDNLLPEEISELFLNKDIADPRELIAANCYAEHLLKNYVHSQYKQHVKQIIDAKALAQSN